MKAFSIKSGVLQINGVSVSGLAAGDDVIHFEPYADAAATDFGADGYLEVAISAVQGGRCTVHTQYTSNVNQFFQNFYNRQVAQGDTFEALSGSWRSNSGASITLAGGILTKQPPIGFGEHATPCVWEFVFERMIVHLATTQTITAASV